MSPSFLGSPRTAGPQPRDVLRLALLRERIYCDAMTGLRFGQPAPDFSLPATTGGEVRLADFRGRDVVLIFYCFDWGSI